MPESIDLRDLGYNDALEKSRREGDLRDFEPARVIAEHKERYIVRAADGELEAEITGNLRYTASSREDYPAVGDWVAITAYETGFAIIHGILPRFSLIKREAAGQSGAVQVIAANIDYAFLVQAIDRDYNVNRLERYLSLCHASRVKPVIVLTKTDLAEEKQIKGLVENIGERIENVPVIALSNQTFEGYDDLKAFLKPGRSCCLLGSSGAGKSTLLNNLAGRELMQTGSLSESTRKGRHITTHRELLVLPEGGILIDNPGMREVGMADAAEGIETTFGKILSLARLCRYRDCTHTGEAGCAVLNAVEMGELDRNSYNNYLRLERENARFEVTVAEKRKKEKIFGKILKEYKKKNVKGKNL